MIMRNKFSWDRKDQQDEETDSSAAYNHACLLKQVAQLQMELARVKSSSIA
jgi:hypothetical protein